MATQFEIQFFCLLWFSKFFDLIWAIGKILLRFSKHSIQNLGFMKKLLHPSLFLFVPLCSLHLRKLAVIYCQTETVALYNFRVGRRIWLFWLFQFFCNIIYSSHFHPRVDSFGTCWLILTFFGTFTSSLFAATNYFQLFMQMNFVIKRCQCSPDLQAQKSENVSLEQPTL